MIVLLYLYRASFDYDTWLA